MLRVRTGVDVKVSVKNLDLSSSLLTLQKTFIKSGVAISVEL